MVPLETDFGSGYVVMNLDASCLSHHQQRTMTLSAQKIFFYGPYAMHRCTWEDGLRKQWDKLIGRLG